jgi:hypothetical protein
MVLIQCELYCSCFLYDWSSDQFEWRRSKIQEIETTVKQLCSYFVPKEWLDKSVEIDLLILKVNNMRSECHLSVVMILISNSF